MSKQHRFISRINGDVKVVPLIPANNVGHRVTALVIALALVLLAAANGMRAAPAGTKDRMAPQAVENPKAGTEFVYFPGLHVNQATESAEHIQAF